MYCSYRFKRTACTLTSINVSPHMYCSYQLVIIVVLKVI